MNASRKQIARPWAPWEIQELKRLQVRRTIEEIARLLWRSPKDVQRAAKTLSADDRKPRATPKTRRTWTSAELATLREVYPKLGPAEAAKLLPKHTLKAVRSKAKVIGCTRRKHWASSEIEQLRKLYPGHQTAEIAATLGRSITAVYGTANKLGLKKSDAFRKSGLAGGFRKGSTAGIAYRFPQGHVPANKGTRRPGWAPGRMKETQFKKGNLSGLAAQNLRPVGTILAEGEGFLRIKVRMRTPDDPPGWCDEVWPLLHHQVWREHHGAIPPQHIVTFKDRDRSNCDPDNLQLMSMADNARRNAMWNRFPKPLIEAIMLNGALKKKIRRLDGKEQTRRPA